MRLPRIPRPRSFRFRITLLATVLSGLVLLAFALWTWEVVRRDSLRRMDQSIRELCEHHLAAHRPPHYWNRAAESFAFVLGGPVTDSFIMLVTGRNGDIIFITDNWPAELPPEDFPTKEDVGFRGDADFPQPPPGPLPIRVQGFFRTGPLNNIPFQPIDWRVGVMSNPEATLVLGLNLEPHLHEMERLRLMFLVAIPCALILIAFGGWFLSRRALRPVETLTRAAESITAEGLDRRIPLAQEDVEFERLINVFNGMLTRLERSFHQAVRFSADAAHELKTPLAILQGELAQAVQHAEPGSEAQQTLCRLLEEVQRLKTITRKLMLLSLADSGQLKPKFEPVCISEATDAAADDLEILAPGLKLDRDIEQGLLISGDEDLIRQVVQNLFNNAVKYNDPQGRIAVKLRKVGEEIRLAVGNSGPGIPPEDRDRVFERFYRADKARNRNVDGTGLGLSLAREIVRAHRGELVLVESRPGWTVFAAVFPAIEPR